MGKGSRHRDGNQSRESPARSSTDADHAGLRARPGRPSCAHHEVLGRQGREAHRRLPRLACLGPPQADLGAHERLGDYRERSIRCLEHGSSGPHRARPERRLLVLPRHRHPAHQERPADDEPRQLHDGDARVRVQARRSARDGPHARVSARAHAQRARREDRRSEGHRVLPTHAGLVGGRGAGSGVNAPREGIPARHRYCGRPVDHVLPDSWRDHEERRANRRRHGHRQVGPPVRRADLPEDQSEAETEGEGEREGNPEA